MLKKILTLTVLATLASSALADTKTASTKVTLDYLPECGISATDMDLGVYNYRTGAQGTATVQVTCNTRYSVKYTGYTGKLKRSGSSDTVDYTVSSLKQGSTATDGTLFNTAGGDLVTETSTLTGSGTGSSAVLWDRFTLIGNVPSGQWVRAGNYSQLITFELDYNLPTAQ